MASEIGAHCRYCESSRLVVTGDQVWCRRCGRIQPPRGQQRRRLQRARGLVRSAN